MKVCKLTNNNTSCCEGGQIPSSQLDKIQSVKLNFKNGRSAHRNSGLLRVRSLIAKLKLDNFLLALKLEKRFEK